VHLLLSYRVNFEGDPARWFNVENYVKFLTTTCARCCGTR
jgi:major vault protein